jgi:hypothetical protein
MYIVLRVKYRFSCRILMKPDYSPQIFDKYSDITFHENPPSGSRVVPCGETDRRTDGQMERHDEANTRFSQFSKRA